MTPLPWQREETLEELQATKEKEEVKLSIDQMRAMRARLREEGLTIDGTFGGSVKAAWEWFRKH